MLKGDRASLSDALRVGGPERYLWGTDANVRLNELVGGSSLKGRLHELRGRSVFLATKDQLAAALALIELDGVARRLVLCPPDLPAEHIPSVIATAAADAIVADRATSELGAPNVGCFIICSPTIEPAGPPPSGNLQTEWILLTSGTTGVPKLVVHTLSTLAAPIQPRGPLGNPAVWSTFYDIRRYGGLQIFLRAVLGGGSMVLSSAAESTAEFLARASKYGVTHISGTPSHWRRALMSPAAHEIAPQYVRLSGEIADQSILDHLGGFYRQSGVAHAFASTEAGVAFEVGDGLAGFPAGLIGRRGADVEMKVEHGSLRIRSTRTAICYFGDEAKSLADKDGFVDTGDMVELQGGRYYFVGRRDGIINVGGRKVHPEEVEAVINRHPSVQISLVKGRRNPITGAIVVADIVVNGELATLGGRAETEPLKAEILEVCHRALAPHKIPAAIRFVPSLDVTASGKLARLGS